jgi:predicted N-acetyltransferase YhbS
MPNPLRIERARPSDFEELTAVLLTCFSIHNPNHPPFDALFPDLYSPADEDMSNNFIIRDGGKIVSIAGLFPLRLDLCGQIVEIGGIGGVATLPAYRGRNLMQTLLDKAHEEMVARGYPFGWLAGDRRRYRPWGYELGSQMYKFHLSGRAPGVDKYLGKLPGKIREGTTEELDWSALWAQARTSPTLAACGSEKLRLKYQRLHHRVYMVDGPRGGHVLLHENDIQKDVEAFAGEPETVGAILAEKLARSWPKAHAFLPLHPLALTGVFDDLMNWYEMITYGSLAVLDLEKTLRCFLPHFDRRVSELGLKGRLTLSMGPARQIGTQTVTLEADGTQLAIRGASGPVGPESRIELTSPQAAELIFSPRSLEWQSRLPEPARWLADLMPVPVFISFLYTV